MRKAYSLLLLIAITSLTAWAQIPANYYDAAKGKKGAELKTAMFRIIHEHHEVGYDGLFDVYEDSDIRPDGKIWDMYSNTTSFDIGDHSSYKKEGDCYNREHSVPQSWFNRKKTERCDAFHVIPTDGYVNNRRSNYPYGETTRATYLSNNGFSKVGPCSAAGYSGTIFEPNDMYKGDLARIYFYMATCYEDSAYMWSGGAFGGNKYTRFETWTWNLLHEWARNDAVSQKEIDRNNAVHKHQLNRNPFVDVPGLEEYIWGDKTNIAFDPEDFGVGGGDERPVPAAPTFSVPSGTVDAGTEVDIECATEGAHILVALNNGVEEDFGEFTTITITETTHVTARSELDGVRSEFVTADYKVRQDGGTGTDIDPTEDSNLFLRVNDADQLEAGRKYLVVCEKTGSSSAADQVALSEQGTDIRMWAEVYAENGTITTETGGAHPHKLTLGGQSGAWTLYDAEEKQYLALNTNGNKLNVLTDTESDNAKWDISVTSSGTTITSLAYPARSIQFNSSAPRFACYTGSQKPVVLYVMDRATGVSELPVKGTWPEQQTEVFDLQGRRMRPEHVGPRNSDRGIYIQNGRIIVK